MASISATFSSSCFSSLAVQSCTNKHLIKNMAYSRIVITLVNSTVIIWNDNTSKFFSSSQSCLSCTVFDSSKILVNVDAWILSVSKKFEAILEIDLVASTVLKCPFCSQYKIYLLQVRLHNWCTKNKNLQPFFMKYRNLPHAAVVQMQLIYSLA